MKVKSIDDSRTVARERLKLMVESEPMECSEAELARMKKEISDIISRYYEITPDNYEIRVLLQQHKKRA